MEELIKMGQITNEKITEIFKMEFGAEVLSVERITDGYSHYMYAVEMDKEPLKSIIRFSNNIKEDVNLGKEKFVIDVLAGKGIPVPKIYAFHFPEKKEEGYMIMEFIEGERLDKIWVDLSKEEKIKITSKIGLFLKKLHSIEFDKFGNINEGGKINQDIDFKFRKEGEVSEVNVFARQFLVEHLKEFARLLSHKKINSEFASKIINYLVLNMDKIEYNGKPKFVHTDFAIDHLFVKKIKEDYEIVGLIDFEFAKAYAPEYDFIKLHRRGFFEDIELKKALVDSYGEINEKAVEIFRLMRDLSFAYVLLDSGSNEMADKVLKGVEEKLDL